MKSGIAAAAIVLISAGGTATGLTLNALTPQDLVPAGLRFEDIAVHLLLQASLTSVGALIVWRRTENRIGWFLSAAAVVSAVLYLVSGYTVYGLIGHAPVPRPEIAAWVFTWLGGSLGLLMGLTVLGFPDGRLRSRSARFGAALSLVGSAFAVAMLALRPGPLLNVPFLDNPFGVAALAEWQELLLAVLFTAFVVDIGILVSSLWQRFHSSTGDERQKMKWMLAAVGIAGGGVPLIAIPFVFVNWDVAKVVFSVLMSLVPLSIGVAILRHRLYDIDVLINRTLVYAATTATLLGLYAVMVLSALALLRPVTQGNELAVALSTLAVASLIQPVRRRMQHAVDRRFYRSRYDAALTLDVFGTRLRNEVDIDALRRDLVEVVRDTMEPAHASVWLRPQ
ncbi:MAG TPA: hypothetical protein VI056_01190 [Candidatus Limnocylindria bacterium]